MPIINAIANYIGSRASFIPNPITVIVNAFKTRVAADSGTFEAESCLTTTVTNLRNIDLA